MYEHMASDGSLDVVNLLTISADTRVLYMDSYHVLKFDDTDAGHLWHYRQGQKLDYMYEHMASARILDVVNLPTISADT